jgi:GT2 family glycosyltransferase
LYYSNLEFETNDISEGAVAFRRDALNNVGLYPESFFISHEGPDLAFRLINYGYKVLYSPDVFVTHAYDHKARLNWRRYYYDTRNQLWFVIRNLSFFYGAKRLLIGWGGMFIYSIRDGFLLYWCKAILDALAGVPAALRERVPPTAQARRRWQQIEANKPPFWTMVRKRLKGNEVRI